MRYLLLIYEDPAATPRASDEVMGAMLSEYGALTDWLQEKDWLKAAAALQDVDTATTVSVHDGTRMVTDGPFAETKEHLGGFYLVDVPSLDDAIEAAARIPGARTGKIEIRPIWETG